LQSQFFDPNVVCAQTKEANDAHGASLQAKCAYTPIEIPSGRTADELWQMFAMIVNAIPENAKLVIDITHGFRSQPIIALAIALYLQTAKSIKVEKIIYGAFEGRSNDNIAPVLDLTPFLEIVNWASATEQFLKYGDAAGLKNQLRATQGKTYAPDSPFRALHLNAVGDKLEKLTDALSLVRPKEVLLNAKELNEELKKAQPDFQNIIAAKPFSFLLDKVVNRFSSFSQTANLFSESGFQAQAQMIEFYLQTEQYQQAILLGREAIVSKVCIQHNFSAIDKDERMKAEDLLCQWSEPLSRGQPVAKEHSKYRELAMLWNKTIHIRNDIAHAGMNEEAAEAKSLIHRIKTTCGEIQKFIIQSF
jgi:CRISPR-associated protein, TM1812 family